MIAAHYSAMKACIESRPALAGKVFAAARLNPQGGLVRETYVILFPTAPDLDDDRFTAVQAEGSTATFEFDVKAVAPTADGVMHVMDHLTAALVGASLDVAGRRCDPVVLTSSDPVAPDDDSSPPMFYADLEFTVVSRRG